MNSRPGKLTGRGVKRLPPELQRRLSTETRDASNARYRVTGFRDGQGRWVHRTKVGTRKGQPTWGYRTKREGLLVKPSNDMLRRSDLISVEIEVDLGQGPRVYFTTVHNDFGG
jgi:hypothetical protein